MKKSLLLFFIAAIAISGCSAPARKTADGAIWVVTSSLMEFKRVRVSGDYKNRWRAIETVETSGKINEKIHPPAKFDCVQVKPDNPKLGSRFCEVVTKYYLVFGSKRAEVSRQFWDEYSPNKIYEVQTDLWGDLSVK